MLGLGLQALAVPPPPRTYPPSPPPQAQCVIHLINSEHLAGTVGKDGQGRPSTEIRHWTTSHQQGQEDTL